MPEEAAARHVDLAVPDIGKPGMGGDPAELAGIHQPIAAPRRKAARLP